MLGYLAKIGGWVKRKWKVGVKRSIMISGLEFYRNNVSLFISLYFFFIVQWARMIKKKKFKKIKE